MQTDVMPSIVQMDKATLKNLVTEVKETVATNVKIDEPSFSAVTMWNIQRNAKSASQMVRRY